MNSTDKNITDVDLIISELLSKNNCTTESIVYNSLPLAIRKRLLYQKAMSS